jgi:hypothetical protein
MRLARTKKGGNGAPLPSDKRAQKARRGRARICTGAGAALTALPHTSDVQHSTTTAPNNHMRCKAPKSTGNTPKYTQIGCICQAFAASYVERLHCNVMVNAAPPHTQPGSLQHTQPR